MFLWYDENFAVVRRELGENQGNFVCEFVEYCLEGKKGSTYVSKKSTTTVRNEQANERQILLVYGRPKLV